MCILYIHNSQLGVITIFLSIHVLGVLGAKNKVVLVNYTDLRGTLSTCFLEPALSAAMYCI